MTDRALIRAFNYPIQTSMSPFIGALIAGNTVVLKPSESSPYTAMVLQRIVEQYLDPSAYAVVQGAVPETTRLLDLKWDKICYTGGEVVGTIVAKKAAETLTPVILELGGRNPAIISKNANPRIAARRLLWSKTVNAGQACVSENYVLIDKTIMPEFVTELQLAYEEFFPKGAKGSPDYGRIVNARYFQKIEKMLKNTRGTILMGGASDASQNYIEPTVIHVTDLNDSLTAEESFGPLIPIYAVDDLDEAIRITNEISVTPLALYSFGTKAETDRGIFPFPTSQDSTDISSPRRNSVWRCRRQRWPLPCRCGQSCLWWSRLIRHWLLQRPVFF
jgi:beta-apo-4'-carotenal oxygenase